MSYDLDIAMQRRPGRLEPLLERLSIRARLEGAFEQDRNVLVTRLGEPERTIDVEGPTAYEPEDLVDDLEPAFIAAVPGARWLAGIHLPGGYAETDDRWALDLAIELAREYGGAVWDPQAERVLWPEDAPEPTRRRPRRETAPTNELPMTWYVPQARMPPDLPSRVLALLRTHLPEGLPDRFGRHEPHEHRLDRDGEAAFVDDWSIEARDQSLLTWAGSELGWSGVVFFRRGDGRRLAPDAFIEVRAAKARIGDVDLADRLAGALAAIADDLDAVYAEAHLEPAMVEIAPTGEVVSPFRNVRALGWAGIPRDPTWLAWFGRPYADLLHPKLAANIDHATQRGFLVRVGRLPMPRQELRAVFPRLPAELVQDEELIESAIDGQPRGRLRPALEIPPLDEP